MDQRGTLSKHAQYCNKLQFLNPTNEQFDWDSDELDDHELLVKDESVSHPGIPYELPGVELEKYIMYELLTTLVDKIDKTHIERANSASANANLPHTQEWSRRLQELIIHWTKYQKSPNNPKKKILIKKMIMMIPVINNNFSNMLTLMILNKKVMLMMIYNHL